MLENIEKFRKFLENILNYLKSLFKISKEIAWKFKNKFLKSLFNCMQFYVSIIQSEILWK